MRTVSLTRGLGLALILLPAAGRADDWGPWQKVCGDGRETVEISTKIGQKHGYSFCRMRSNYAAKVSVDVEISYVGEDGKPGKTSCLDTLKSGETTW
jgi:hypothetical protein